MNGPLPGGGPFILEAQTQRIDSGDLIAIERALALGQKRLFELGHGLDPQQIDDGLDHG